MMSNNKTVHTVFQVLNFLRSPDSKQYKLTPVDQLILIYLANHEGKNGIYPSQATLAHDLNIKERHLRDKLVNLRNTGLIMYEKMGRKYHYKLSTIAAPQCRYCSENCNKHRHPSAGITGTPVPVLSIYSNNDLTMRGRRKRALPLPVSFMPNEQSRQVISELKLSSDMLQEFKDFCGDKGILSYDWQARYRKYLRDEKKYLVKKNSTTIPALGCTIRNTIQDFPKKPPLEGPCTDAVREAHMEKMRNLLKPWRNDTNGHQNEGAEADGGAGKMPVVSHH